MIKKLIILLSAFSIILVGCSSDKNEMKKEFEKFTKNFESSSYTIVSTSVTDGEEVTTEIIKDEFGNMKYTVYYTGDNTEERYLIDDEIFAYTNGERLSHTNDDEYTLIFNQDTGYYSKHIEYYRNTLFKDGYEVEFDISDDTYTAKGIFDDNTKYEIIISDNAKKFHQVDQSPKSSILITIGDVEPITIEQN